MGKVLVARTRTPDFVIGIVPDPQNMVRYYPLVWASLCDWLVAQKDVLNIKAVVCMGDNVDQPSVSEQWTAAMNGIGDVEAAGIPYLPVMGNHDYNGGDVEGRDADAFDANLGPAHFSGKSYYAGNYGSSNGNYYATIDYKLVSLLILMLELFPRAEAVAWAQSVIAANPSRQVIIVTHSFLTAEGTQTTDASDYGINNYGFSTSLYNGQEIWAAFKGYANLLAILCGHDLGAYAAHRSDNADDAHPVQQIFSNFQGDTNGGDGWVGLMRFSESDSKCYVTYYRTYEPSGLGEDEAKAFSFDWVP